MQAAPGMHVEWVEGEAVVLDSSSNRLFYLNSSAALVYALIQEHGFEGAMKELDDRFGGDPQVKEELPDLLDQLVDQGLLIDG